MSYYIQIPSNNNNNTKQYSINGICDLVIDNINIDFKCSKKYNIK